MVEVIRIRNADALFLPEIATLVIDSFEKVEAKQIADHLPKTIEEDHVAFLAAREDGAWKGYAWVRNSLREDEKSALVVHFYCKGNNKRVRDALVKAVVDFAKAGGMETLTAWDINKKPRAFERIFKAAGPAREIIRAYEFDLTGATTDATDPPTHT